MLADLMHLIGVVCEAIVIIYIVIAIIIYLSHSNTQTQKPKQTDRTHQQQKLHQQLKLKSLKKAQLAQQLQEQGRKLGMLITTIENIDRPFKPLGLVMDEGSSYDAQSWSSNIKLGLEGGNKKYWGPLHVDKKFLIKHLIRDVHEKGGNALIGLRILIPDPDGYIAYGTAIKLK